MALVNPEFFLEEERLRMKIKVDKEAAALRLKFWRPTRQFRRFPKLSLELRRIIWKFAAKEPRLVEFTCYPKQKSIVSRFPSRTTVPAILHTSQEARTCGLEVYEKLDFGSLFDSTFINWELDVVLFESGKAMTAFMNIESLIHEPVALGGAANSALGIESVHSTITKNCCNLAIYSKDIETFKTEFRSWAHFRSLSEFYST